MRQTVMCGLIIALLLSAGRASGQQTLSVGIGTECRNGQVYAGASTYHSDPYCTNYATAPGGGCTQWHLFKNGQMVLSKYTVPAGGGGLDYYTAGRFPLTQPGAYQIKMSYSRIVCSGWWIFQTCHFDLYVNETPVINISAADLLPANWANKCPVGSFDGVNCFITVKPAGGFMWGRGFYMPAGTSTNCPVGSYDGAHCLVMPKPANGFIWSNGFYVPAGSGHSCSVGTYDGANCFILKAPWGTNAFEFAGNFYVTTMPSCAQGTFDGANCLIATAPLGTNMFEWGGNYYVTPRPPCQ
jgi:hypothetical protein